MSLVEQYWSGVLRRMQAEVDVFNNLINHAGEMGRENELSLARVLSSLVPRRFGIGSGLLIDTFGNDSKQMDIIIYDQTEEPALLAQTNQVLFPVENVHACIEVKTTINKEQIRDAGAKKQSIERLRSRDEHSLPIFALVGFGAGLQAETIVDHISDLGGEIDTRPDLIFILDLGLYAVRRSLLAPDFDSDGSDYIIGLTLLHEREVSGARIPQTYRQPPRAYQEDDFSEAGTIYPIVQIKKDYWIAEPSRALLLFCDTLVSNLAARQSKRPPAIRHYISGAARDLVFLAE